MKKKELKFGGFGGAGRFLRMFVGPINVRATRKDVQLKVKEDYNSFKVNKVDSFVGVVY